jgi:hypothetical protein
VLEYTSETGMWSTPTASGEHDSPWTWRDLTGIDRCDLVDGQPWQAQRVISVDR